MTKINISKITAIVILGASSLLAQGADNTSYAQIVTEIENKQEKKVLRTVEKTPQATPVKIEVISEKTEPVVEKTIQTTPKKPVIVTEEVTEVKTIVESIVEKMPVIKELPAPKSTQKMPQTSNTQISDIIIRMPAVPKPPKVTVIVPQLILLDSNGKLITKESMESLYKKEPVVFSSRVAPDRFNANINSKKTEILAGDILDSRVAAYLHSPLISVDEAKAKLEKAGFEVLSTFKVDKKGKVTSIVFTNDAMNRAASKNMRGFAGALRVLVDTKNKVTVISNPVYLMKAFMQKDYDQELAVNTLTSLRDAFGDVKNSQEMMKFRTLERFHFMENMPYYQDMKLVSEGKNKDLLAKAKKSKKVVFEQHLANGSILIGVKLGKRTSKFVKKIGFQNAGLLPYPILIENGKAKILTPQYYIAIMYPQLKMSQFMTIATVPGAILKDIDRIFR